MLDAGRGVDVCGLERFGRLDAGILDGGHGAGDTVFLCAIVVGVAILYMETRLMIWSMNDGLEHQLQRTRSLARWRADP